MTSDVRPRSDPWLLVILLVGLSLRLLFFTAPYADAHRWRQLENLAVAWNFEQGSLNPFYPEAIWGGLRDAYVEMEFPLVPYVIAVAWRLFGEHEAYGRLVGIASSLILIATTYALGRELFSRGAARGAALLLAVSPSAVFFGRVPMTDTPMIACSALAVFGYLRYFASGARGWAIGGAIAAMLAWLLKIPSLLILGPIVVIAWQARGWRLLADRWFIGGLAAAFLVTTGWYIHALRLYEQTGWTVGIWHEAGQHPPRIAATTGAASTFSLWSSSELLTNPNFYKRLADRLWQIHLTPFGLAGLLFGIVRALPLERAWIVLTWFAAACSFVLVVGQGNYFHEYYQLPLLPPAALLFGLGTAMLFDPRRDAPSVEGAAPGLVPDTGAAAPASSAATRRWHHRLDRVSRPAFLIVLALASFHYSGVVRNYFRPETLDRVATTAGEIMGNHVPRGDGVIVVEYAQGTNSPVLLYFMRHRGWSFDMKTISPHVIEHLRQQGATHFATSEFYLLEDKRPDIIEHLRMYREVPLGSKAPETARLFELH